MPEERPERGFLAELKRRHVYRVGAMYAAAAFVVWQVMDIAVPALDLPDWLLGVVVVATAAGFPVALVLAWLYELTPAGVRRTADMDEPGHDGASTAPQRAPKAAWLAAAAVVLVSIGLGGRWAASHWQAPDPSELHLAVFPFEVRGTERLDYLREGMVDLLSRNMAGAAGLQPLDPSLVLKLTRGAEPADPESAGALAREVGAGQFVLGSVHEVGGQLRIDAALYSLRDSISAIATKSVQGDTTQLFELVDQLTAALLAERITGVASERIIRTAALTTSSLEALKHYLIGEQNFRAGRQDLAIDALRRAVDTDSMFALARYRLALAHHLRHQHADAGTEVGRALQAATGLTAHDRDVIAAFHALHEGDVVSAETRLRSVIRTYPRDLEARVLLAGLITDYAPLRGESVAEARELLDEVIQADPKFACIHCMLSNVTRSLGDTDQAERWMRLLHGNTTGDTISGHPLGRFWASGMRGDTSAMRAFTLQLDTLRDAQYGGLVTHRFAEEAAATGHFEIADWILHRSEARPAVEADRLHAAGMVNLGRGRWREAGDQLTRAIPIWRPWTPQFGSVLLLMFAPFDPALSTLHPLRAQLQEWRPTPAAAGARSAEQMHPAARHYLLGLIAARLSEHETARAHADSLATFAPGVPFYGRYILDMARTVRADVAVREDRPADALNELDAVDPHVPPTLFDEWISAPTYAAAVRARAHLDLGQHEQALRWLKHGRSVARWGAQDVAQFGIWNRDMARALDGLGRLQEAAAHYGRFIDAFAGADPELQPQVAAARTRMNQLQAAGR